MTTSRALGWAGVGAILAWLYFDYQARSDPAQLNRAILAGWFAVALVAAHIGSS